jgi:hypothetical protein
MALQKSERQKIEWLQLIRGMWREDQNLNPVPIAALEKFRGLMTAGGPARGR